MAQAGLQARMGSLTQRQAIAGAATLAVVLMTSPLAGQSAITWIAGGGLSLPAGEFNKYANNGWDVTAAVERSFGRHPTAVRIGLGYAVNKDETRLGFRETTKLSSVFGSVVYHFVGSRPHIFGLIGFGWFRRDFTSDDPDDSGVSDRRFAVQIGEGVTFRAGPARLFIEGRFITTVGPGPFQYFPLIAGVRLGGGGS